MWTMKRRDLFAPAAIGLTLSLSVMPVGCGGTASTGQRAAGGLGATAGDNSANAGAAGREVGSSAAGGADVGSNLDAGAAGREVGSSAAGEADVGSDLGCGPGSGSGLSHSSDPARAEAERLGLDLLERLLKPLLTGTVPVYRGTLVAHDNASVLGDGLSDQNIPLGSAVAELYLDQYAEGARSDLFIISTATRQFVQIQQPALAPGTTNVFVIRDESGSTPLLSGPCQACAPGLADSPPTIVLNDTSGSDAELGLTITVSANLSLTAGCSLSSTELVALDSLASPLSLSGFEHKAGELVMPMSGHYPRLEPGQCGLITTSTIELFIDASRPWVYGVRNYAVDSQHNACGVGGGSSMP